MRFVTWNDSPIMVTYWGALVAINGSVCLSKVRHGEVTGLADDLVFLAIFAFALGWNLRGYVEGRTRGAS